MLKTQILFILIGLGFTCIGQQICGTTEYEKRRGAANPNLESTEEFEEWVWEGKKRVGLRYIQQEPYVVPVVFHVIHNGEPIGTGGNVSDDELHEELVKLNNNFQRKNSDTINTPAPFQPIAGRLNIKFVIAKQDPNGIPTSGILRKRGSQSKWDFSTEKKLKAHSYWPSNDYLNIWVTDIMTDEGSGLLGYAQFPISSRVRGLSGSNNDAKQDGIALSPIAVISTLDQDVLTHEVGHLLGLRHIWGDIRGCNNNGDYVNDTPPQNWSQSGCPDFPVSDNCSQSIMFHNYMDYTKCGNIFTQEQVQRMTVILENSPRRKSLLTSMGSKESIFKENDIRILQVTSPKEQLCNNEVSPGISVINWGKNPVSSTRVRVRIDNQPEQIKTFKLTSDNLGSPLKQFDRDTLFFDPMRLTNPRKYTFTFEVLDVNNTHDEEPKNSIISTQTYLPKRIEAPLFESFTNGIANWSIINPDASITWQPIKLNQGNTTNTSVYLDFYNYPKTMDTPEGELKIEQQDKLISPIIYANTAQSTDIYRALLQFDWFYAPPFDEVDRLQVVLISGCNHNVAAGEVIFDKSGKQLASSTISQRSTSASPTDSSQWQTALIPLKGSIEKIITRKGGNPNDIDLQVMFVGTNGYGYKLYLDNISLYYPGNTYTLYTDQNFNTTRIAFNLKKPQLAKVSVYNMLGQLLSEDIVQEAWKQTHTIHTDIPHPGIYLFRVHLNGETETTRLFMKP